MNSAPFQVAEIFNDAEDMSWFMSTLMGDIIDHHAPLKTKRVKKDSVPYMNSKFRKSQYLRNMARNKYKTFGKQYWEVNRRQRNKVVAIGKQSLAQYFENNCPNQDKTFWSTV